MPPTATTATMPTRLLVPVTELTEHPGNVRGDLNLRCPRFSGQGIQ